jgi:DGQHR domain-containing protein
MADGLTGLVSDEALRSVWSARGKAVDEKTVTGGSATSLALKVQGEEADGWRVHRRNKTSVRMIKDKSVDRQLEDDVWTLLARMGFKELNADRQFKIQMSDRAPARQLDVFAKDDETVFVVECTHARAPGDKSVKALVDKINGIREDVIKAVHSHYGRDPKLKVKFAIATRHIEWREADRVRAEGSGIAIITDEDLSYFRKLTDILRTAARYQFLGRYLRGEKVEGLRTRVPATRGRVGKTTFYNLLMSPHDLLRIAYISHRAKEANEDLSTYQRMVKPKRLSAIGKFIDEGGTFPTNIVVNIKHDSLQFDVKENFGETSTGILTLPGQYGAAWVIDGQHRLYGYAYGQRSPKEDHSVVSVLAYENLPTNDEIQMFIDINTQQVKVSRNLVNEIVSSLDIEHEDLKRRLEALAARVALKLDSLSGSPLKDRILTVSQDKDNVRCLTLTSLADGISGNNLMGVLIKSGKSAQSIQGGPLSSAGGTAAQNLDKATRVLALYFNLFAEPLADHWALGDAKGGYLCTNLGLRALLQLLRRLIVFIERDGIRGMSLDAEELVERLAPYVQPIVQFFASADPGDVARFRSRGSSLASVDQNTLQLMAIIYEAMPKFDVQEVREYIESQDAEGTRRAKDMIADINQIIFDDVLVTLKGKFGELREAWWMEGVPKAVRNECDRAFNDGDGRLERWRYLVFDNYADILLANWDLFKDRYNFHGRGQKAKLIAWLGRINKARAVTNNAEKGPLSKDEVAYVTKVHELVRHHIQDGVEVDVRRPPLGAAPQDNLESAA